MSSSHDARVVVAVSSRTPSGFGADVVDAIESSLDATVLHKRGSVATEFLRELGPTLDCVVVVSVRSNCVENIASAARAVPLIVYGDEVPTVPVDEVIATDGGTDLLARRVSERVERERERNALAEANAKLSALNVYTEELTGCQSVKEVSDTVVSAVTNALGHGQCALALREGDEFYPYGHTYDGELNVRLDTDEGIAGRTYQTGETQIVSDYRTDPDHVRDIDGLRSVVSVPVGDIGVLQVTTDRRAAFDRQDAEFIEIVGSHAAEALARLEREADLRVERDRLHYFFDGIKSPAVYVESTDGGEPVLTEMNSAYEAMFGSQEVGRPVSEAFPTDTERALFGSDGPDDVTHREITRETDDGPVGLTVGVVPIPISGIETAAFGLYAASVEFP
ncbi:GAF domain-containing protein [Halobaculum gomorrense]|uniref:GAF domain-containing protein n=1 Tax=Halobaculum gomorrense TaxID=43928 RepID=A0A1M5KFV8_9EURY|nr:GAF domain-containing protein [Halobaculum gomorrense]SHG51490.1 GAF domain-containing protein [Halobaculum gomorrense]